MALSDWIAMVDAVPSPAVAGAAAGCLMLCLMTLWQLRAGRLESHRARQNLAQAVDKLAEIKVERAVAETESRTLRRLAETANVDDAVNVLLEHCLPEVNAGLAAYFDLSPEG